MTSDPRYNHLREQSWTRNLTQAEEAELRVWLAAHPDAQLDSEAEAALTQALRNLPDVPVPSNFTARVLQVLKREETAQAPEQKAQWRAWLQLHRWLPRAAVACLLVGMGLFSYRQHQAKVELERNLESIERVSAVRSLPSPDVLENFEAIRAMRRTGPDEELLALYQ